LSEIVETDEGVTPAVAQRLQIIAGSMAGGLTLMAGFISWAYLHGAQKVPTPDHARFVNLLTTVAMLVAVCSIVASEILWRRLLKTAPGPLGSRVQAAFIARLALREGASFMGLAVAYLSALNGVLRAYPAYWVNLAPYGLFVGFLAAHWPTAEKLAAEARESLGS
jgi:hypothetical protein